MSSLSRIQRWPASVADEYRQAPRRQFNVKLVDLMTL